MEGTAEGELRVQTEGRGQRCTRRIGSSQFQAGRERLVGGTRGVRRLGVGRMHSHSALTFVVAQEGWKPYL
jgi:hypothetical protein